MSESRAKARARRARTGEIDAESEAKLIAELEQLHAASPDQLRAQAERLVLENHALQQLQQQVKTHHEKLREELDERTVHPRYPVVIRCISRNGAGTVEVAGPNIGPVEVAVHPEVQPDQLRVGARGVLNRERNCLLAVNGQPADWREVATFEYALPDGRVVVNHQGQTLVVTPASTLDAAQLRPGDQVGFEPGPIGLAFEILRGSDHEHLFDEAVPEDDFKGIGGLDEVIAKIKLVVAFATTHRAIAEKYGVPPKRGILLYGPPGNGKTRIARCLANYLQQMNPHKRCRFMSILASSDYNPYLGASEANILGRFAAGREAAKDGLVVMYWDEIDSIARRRGTDYGSAAPDRILNTLLGSLDGLQRHENILFVASTNRADTLDPGIIRPGRLDEKFYIPPPNRRGAQAILRCYLTPKLPLAAANADALIDCLLPRIFSPEGPYKECAVVKMADGGRIPVRGRDLLSGAVLEHVVHSAAEQAAVREMEAGVGLGITEEDLVEALDRAFRSTASLLTPENVKAYVDSIPSDARPIAIERPGRGRSRNGYVRLTPAPIGE